MHQLASSSRDRRSSSRMQVGSLVVRRPISFACCVSALIMLVALHSDLGSAAIIVPAASVLGVGGVGSGGGAASVVRGGAPSALPLLSSVAVASSGGGVGGAGLCELREEDGLQCECRDSEALCEVTRPLVAFVPATRHRKAAAAAHQPSTAADHQLPTLPVPEALKRRRDTTPRTINTLVLQSPRNESFLGAFPADVLQEPLQFKNISMVHASLGELASFAVSGSRFLKELTLRECGITRLLRFAITDLQKLQKMDLSSNQISTLQVGSLMNLPALQELAIAHSGLSVIEPHTFVELSSLEKLNLRDNELDEIDNRLFTGLHRLEELDLSFNFLRRVEDNTFADLPNLRHLDLTGNRITVVTPRSFSGLRHLAHLSLNYNDLAQLPNGFLHDSQDLRELNLGRNHLQAVTLDTLSGVKVIRSNFVLTLKPNPLNCSCDLFYLTELRKRRMSVSGNDFQDPPEFENLQCRRHYRDTVDPRPLDEEFFESQTCQPDPMLAEHMGLEPDSSFGPRTAAQPFSAVALVTLALSTLAVTATWTTSRTGRWC